MLQRVYTVGHSTRPIDEFLQVLRSHGVQRLIDVRTMPRSRFNPQFDIARLPSALSGAAIHYTHMPELGGLRKPRQDSLNLGWRNSSFRGYADYMQTADFARAVDRALAFAAAEAIALMCAEAVPWRCHRSLIADTLIARGVEVLEISGEAKARPHKLTSFARIEGNSVRYPAVDQLPLEPLPPAQPRRS